MNKLRWLARRSSVMSLPEVVFRVLTLLKDQVYRLGLRYSNAKMPEYTKGLLCKNWFTPPESTHISFQLSNEEKQLCDELCVGRISLFGYEKLNIGQDVNWHRDPLTGIVAPCVFSKSINYRDDRVVGNITVLWAIGIQQHLVPLTLAYLVTNDEKYMVTVTRHIDSWITQCPESMGVHWCSSLEIAFRLISWIVVHQLLCIKHKEGLFAFFEDKPKLENSIFRQLLFISDNLSRYSSANNHLIGELVGIWVVCNSADFGSFGDKLKKFAKRGLEEQASRQVYSDGVNKEQAFHYHAGVLEFLLFSQIVAEINGDSFCEEFKCTIKKMAGFLLDMTPRNGSICNVGDADDSTLIKFSLGSTLTLYEEILESEQLWENSFASGMETKESSNKIRAYGFMIQNAGNDDETKAVSKERRYPVFYNKGGYSILGDDRVHIQFDTGRLGYTSIAAHGHADALSVCLAIDGQWWLDDPGTYAYHSLHEWRDYFRSTRAHNTIEVNDENQSISGGGFLWTKHRHAGFISGGSDSHGVQKVSGRLDGYSKYKSSIHKRQITYNPKIQLISIEDELRKIKGKPIKLHWHCHPEVQVEWDKNRKYWLLKRCGSDRKVYLKISGVDICNVIAGQTDPTILGWHSCRLGSKTATRTIQGVKKNIGSDDVCILTEIELE